MKLRELIESLKSSSTMKSLNIANIGAIIKNLEKMDSMIEMDEVKETFVKQILLFLMMRRQGYVPPFKKMHSVLSGPPGVGKTTMSILIAQIWAALNITDKSTPIQDTSVSFSDLSMTECVPLPTEMKIQYKRDIAHTMTEMGDKLTDTMITLDLEYEGKEAEDIPEFIKNIYSKTQDTSDLCQEIVDKYSKYFKELKENNDTEASITPTLNEKPYIILGRGDFVAAHVGETSIKTKEILEANKGKIIIIEEAYTLFTSEKDSFGMEALTLINRYMDECCDDYIFIFNGYMDKLEETIFRAQPGLRRRIQWQFNIEKYTADGIYKIFKRQLGLSNKPVWKIKPRDESKFEEFFNRNKKYFPHFGGDTEKLILQLQLQYGETFFESINNSFEISYKVLDDSFREYIKTSYVACPAPPFGLYT